MINAPELTSTQPYLIRAIHEWCLDNGFTPYIVVSVNESVQVPREFVKDGEIVLNASYDATSGLQLGNDFIEFKARFGGKPHDIIVPLRRVVAIYARENGQGMAFALDDEPQVQWADTEHKPPAKRGPLLQSVDGPQGLEAEPENGDEPRPPSSPGGGGRPALKRVK